MADSEGPPTDKNDPGDTVPPQAKPLAPAPRANPPNINAAKDAPSPDGPPGFGDFLEWMRSQSGGEAAPGTAAQRGLIPKEKKKFQRRDAEGKPEKPAESPSAAPTAVPKETPVPTAEPGLADAPVSAAVLSPVGVASSRPSRDLPVAAETPSARVRRQQAPLKRNGWLSLATQAVVLALLAGSFLLGRASITKVTAPPAAPAAPEVVNGEGKVTTKLLSDANAARIDGAMAAEQNNDFKKAAELLGEVKASGESVRGLTFQLAQLAVFQGDHLKALRLLNEALAAGENLGAAYNLRATVIGQKGLITGEGLIDYETATKIDPFEARNFFYWGEALRRRGKEQAAVTRLQQAIDRLREPEMESHYRLTLRLAQIESGRETEFADELAKQLALPNPSMDWLVTAAAIEMHAGRFAAAADYLDRAASRGETGTFPLRLYDYYLYQFKYEKELVRFYSKSPPPKRATEEPPAAPAGSSGPNASAPPPGIGLDVPVLPPPASPAATVPR